MAAKVATAHAGMAARADPVSTIAGMLANIKNPAALLAFVCSAMGLPCIANPDMQAATLQRAIAAIHTMSQMGS